MTRCSSTARAHASVDVLTNRVLWDAITDCMTGYPLTVVNFIRASVTTTYKDKLERAKQTLTPATAHVVGHLSHRGELVHLAIAANDTDMLDTLHRLFTHAQYQNDVKLGFQKAMRCAVVCNSISMLEHIAKLKRGSGGNGSDVDCQLAWEPNLMSIALLRDDPDLRMLGWLVTHLSRTSYSLTHKSLVFHAERGDLGTVQWLHKHGRKISQAAMDEAARNNHLQVLQYFYKHSAKRCSREGANNAASEGHLSIVKHIAAHEKKLTLDFALMLAAVNGHITIVQFLVENVAYVASAQMSFAINVAASSGHVDVVQYLNEHFRGNDSTVFGIGDAAANGHLDVVKYLHEHRPGDCNPKAIGHAVEDGHLAIVQYLHEHNRATCAHECPPTAFDQAAAQGHIEVVKFLHEHRTEGCTADALARAAMSGHTDVVMFLVEHRTEGDVLDALRIAALHGHLELVQRLHSRLEHGQSAFAAVCAAMRRQHHALVKFLCEHQEHESERFLKQAVASDMMQVVKAVARYASTDELIETKSFAMAQDRLQIVEFLELVIKRQQCRNV